jgi:uncharacterized repeat protein (TIGR01451 family)
MSRKHQILTLWIVAICLLVVGGSLARSAAASPVDHERVAIQAVFDPALSLVGEFAPGSVGVPGEQVVWTITVVNTGDAAGTDILITDTLNANMRIDQVEMDLGTYSANGQTVVFDIPALNPCDTAQMRLTTTVLSGPGDGLLVNQVVLTGQGPGGTVTDRAITQLSMPTRLPSTGYPPPEDLPGEGEPSVFMVGLVALASVLATAYMVWRRANTPLWYS